MASSSSSGLAASVLGHPITEKLAKNNYALWKLQVLPAVRGAQLTGYLDGKTVAPPVQIDGKEGKQLNPEYTEWVTKDQNLLSYLLSTLSRDALSAVSTCVTAAQVWSTLEGIYASQTRARAVNTRIAFATTKKENLTITEYVGKMKALGDNVTSAGTPLGDEELVQYVLAGLDMEYNPIVSAVLTRVESISINELYSQLLSFEQRLDLLSGGSNSSANSASRGGRGGGYRGGNRSGRSRGGRTPGGRSASRGPNNGNRSNNNGARRNTGPRCQVCFKPNHTAAECWHRFDEDYVPDERHVAAAASSYNVDTNWYTDTGSTDHITSELENFP